MASLLAPTGRSRILLRVVALLSGAAVAGVPVLHALAELPGSGPGVEAEHSAACQVAHGSDLCAAAAGVLIARPAGDPGVRPASPIDAERRADAPPVPPSTPPVPAAEARAPPTR
jgi:hypothetical protein